jgi:hypothetical protein
MIIPIKQYKYEKTEIASKDFELPDETAYFFETHVRRSIRIKPVYTTWQKEQHNKEEEIWRFEITCVYLSFECKIEKFSVDVNDFKKDKEVIEKNNFLNAWTNGWFDKRTKEDFENDLKQAFDKINE